MKGPFSYLDYRLLLKDRFAELKSQTRGITHRSLAKKAGFSSPNFLQLVMAGKRNLSDASIPKVCQAMEWSGKEAEFFSHLVEFNQARDVLQKDQAYAAMKSLRKDLSLQRLEHSQFEYFEHWYTVAIRELLSLADFKEDPVWIQKKLLGKVSLPQIKNSLKLLERLGLAERDAKGRLVSKHSSLSTGDEVSGLGVYRFHQGMMEKAKESLTETPPPQRDISSITLALTQSEFLSIKKRIQDFRKELLAMGNTGRKADAVYQLNMQLFNLTEIPWKA